MPQLTLQIAFTNAYVPTTEIVDFDIIGEPDDKACELLAPYADPYSVFFVFIWYEGFERPVATPIDCTLGELLNIVDVLDSDHGRIRVDNAGRGGDPLETVTDVLNVLGYFLTAYEAQKLSKKFQDELIYGRKHSAARDWLRGGRAEVLDPLRSWVRAYDVWREADFTRRFGLSGDEAYRLLRATGYEYYDRDRAWWIINNNEPQYRPGDLS